MKPRSLISIFVLVIVPALVQADITGMFSSMRVSERSGDFTGLEVHIVPALNGFAMVLQASEGAPGVPDVFELSVDRETVRFVVPSGSRCGLEPGEYEAKIREDSFILLDPNGTRIIPRRQSYWR